MTLVDALEKLLANGKQFMELKEEEKAQAAFLEVTEKYPEDWRGWWNLALVRLEIGVQCGERIMDDKATIKELENAATLAPAPQIEAVNTLLEAVFQVRIKHDDVEEIKAKWSRSQGHEDEKRRRVAEGTLTVASSVFYTLASPVVLLSGILWFLLHCGMRMVSGR